MSTSVNTKSIECTVTIFFLYKKYRDAARMTPFKCIAVRLDKLDLRVKERQDRLPTMYWLPKLHKRPYKARFIANSSMS